MSGVQNQNPAPQYVYDSEYSGTAFSYVIPGFTPRGTYTVRLHFAEIYNNAAGLRLFNVTLNGTQVLTNFDVWVAAGNAMNKALIKSYTTTADANGVITISFLGTCPAPQCTNPKPNSVQAKISGIEIYAGGVPPPSGVPQFIQAGGSGSGSFVADTDFNGGAPESSTAHSIDTSQVTNPAPPQVYQGGRTGNYFNYRLVSLSPGKPYVARLHFAEHDYSAVDARSFNVAINNQQVLTNFDILANANGEYKAIVEQFNATADSAGTISIAFAGVKNGATVQGIELEAGTLSSGGTLTGSLGTPLQSVNLTNEGTSDWAFYGYSSWSSFDDKSTGGQQISNYSAIGGSPTQFTSDFTGFSWSDGAPDSSVTNTKNGVSMSGPGNGFSVTVPADTTPRTLRVYTNVFAAAAKLTAVLSDGSSPAYSSTALSNGSTTAQGVYTLTYSAASAGQHLAVTFTENASLGSGAAVSLEAVTMETAPPIAPVTDYTQYHYDTLHTGWNPNESTLTTSNVNSATFGKRASFPVDGDVYAQPLYVANYPVNGANHNVLIVATEHNSVYAYDADSTSSTPLWHRSLGPSQAYGDIGCGDIRPEYGITGTPVINRATGSIYVVAATEINSFTYHTQLHALDIATGNDQRSPVEIAASVTMSNGSQLSFVTKNQMNRASLLFANNSIYVAFGSHCDSLADSTSGWLLRYDTNLNQTSSFATAEDGPQTYGTSPNQVVLQLAAIWGAGNGPVADAQGNIYAITGNGAFDANMPATARKNFGESVIKLPSDLSQVLSYFTVSTMQNDNLKDQDFGSGGVMLLPPQAGSVRDTAVAMGKPSNMYLLNAASLGGYAPGPSPAADSGALQAFHDSGKGIWGGPAYYSGPTGQYVYYQTLADTMRSFAVGTNAAPNLTYDQSGSTVASYGGSTGIVTSNGQLPGTGILWTIQRQVPLVLEAYDATNLGNLLYSSDAGSFGGRTNAFITPLAINGKVYVGSTAAITVFGLNSQGAALSAKALQLRKTLLQPHAVRKGAIKSAIP